MEPTSENVRPASENMGLTSENVEPQRKMSTYVPFSVRVLREEELPVVLGWVREDGWSVSLNILKACHKLDPQGWLVAERTAPKSLIGLIVCCHLNDKLAFGGFYCTRIPSDLHGVGEELWKACREHVGDRNLGINMFETKVGLCYDVGVSITDSHFAVQTFFGTVHPEGLAILMKDLGTDITLNQHHNRDRLELSRLLSYDRKVHNGIKRLECMKRWFSTDTTTTVIAKKTYDVCGYGCLQKLEDGRHHVGPVFADSVEIAACVIVTLLQSVPPAQRIFMAGPTSTGVLTKFAYAFGWSTGPYLRRMYTKEIVHVHLQKVFVFTTMGIALI